MTFPLAHNACPLGLALKRVVVVAGIAVGLSSCFGSETDPHFQTTVVSTNAAIILDTRSGDLWSWATASPDTLRYVGRATTKPMVYNPRTGKNGERPLTDEELLARTGASGNRSGAQTQAGWTIREVHTPPVGCVLHGYRFNGGDSADPANWEPSAERIASLRAKYGLGQPTGPTQTTDRSNECPPGAAVVDWRTYLFQSAQRRLPSAGDTSEGYRFKGGDPNDAANWQKL